VQQCSSAAVQRCRDADEVQSRGTDVQWQRCKGEEVLWLRDVERCRDAEVQMRRGAEVQLHQVQVVQSAVS